MSATHDMPAIVAACVKVGADELSTIDLFHEPEWRDGVLDDPEFAESLARDVLVNIARMAHRSAIEAALAAAGAGTIPEIVARYRAEIELLAHRERRDR